MTLVLQDTLVLSPATAQHLQDEIDTIEAGTDVTDVVGTYEDLEEYNTSQLTDKDIIKVLQDETHDNAQTYWRWSASNQEFSYVGEIATPPVTSVNSKVGEVVLDYSDVGAQQTLVSGTNIKTINGNNILGSGDLELTQFLGFPSDWPTTSSTTTKAFCDVVAADADAIEGKMYLGEVRWSDLSTVGLVNAEVAVKIMKGTTAASKVIVLTMSSGNHAPYQWQYTYWNGGASTSGWIGFQPELPSQSGQSGKFLTTNGSSMSWGTVDLSTKVDKTNSASKVYGTDVNGAQTTYNVDSFGQVDDVKINNTSIVNNKIANITIDNALNTSSTNAVQNGVVATAINNKSGVVFKTWSD